MRKVNSTTKTLYQIMAKEGPYEIPYNQRPYTWGKSNWEALWNSLFPESDQEKDVFFGSLIFLEPNPDEIKETKQIFDGQQRITTLTIMTKSLADVLSKNNAEKLATSIGNEFLADHDKNPMLIVSTTIRDYFQKNIQDTEAQTQKGNHKIEKEIYKAYSFFYKQFAELLKRHNDDTSKLRDHYRQRLKEIEVVEMTIKDIVLGIEIFESVNHRGEQLNASELVKNIIIKYTHKKNERGEKNVNISLEDVDTRWNLINNKLSLTGFSFIEFLHYYWLSRYKPVGKKQLFGAMKKEFGNDSDKWILFFEDLELTAATFENIYSCQSYDSFKIQYEKAECKSEHHSTYMRYLNCFPFIKNKSWIVPIFSLLDYETKLNKTGNSIINKDNFLVKVFKKHFVFSFLHFNIFSLPTRDFSPEMYALGRKINSAIIENPQNAEKSNKQVHKAFYEYFTGYAHAVSEKYFTNNDEDLLEGINKLRYSQKNRHLIYTLFEDIESLFFRGTPLDPNKTTIEHFMPRKSKDTWNISEDISRIHEDKIGNILIIDASLNRKMGNKSHIEKLNLLKTNTLTKLNKAFIEEHEKSDNSYDFSKIMEENLKNSDFDDNPSEIDKRTKQIAKYLKDIYITNMKY